MWEIPRMDPQDPNYRRSMYIRYADDFVFLLEGPKSEALEIQNIIKKVLEERTGLELNDEKTLITHVSEGFNFLGAHIKVPKHSGFRMSTTTSKGTRITMRANVRARINAPIKTLIEKLIKAGLARRDNRNKILSKAVTALVNLDHATILQFYNSKISGLVNYYSLASNRVRLKDIF